MNISANVPCLLTEGVKFDLFVKSGRTGKIEKRYSGKNLILDSGLTLWGEQFGASLTIACAVGDGTEVNVRDSGTITCSRSGTTVTTGGAASFFEADDVGRLLRFDTGEETYISSFTSVSEVETVTSGTIAADEFNVQYVDTSILDNELARSGSYQTNSGDNGSTQSAGVVNHKRTHIFSAVAAAVTYQEIGWSNDVGAGNPLFNRALISGGISLLSGDRLLVVSNLEIIQSPQTPTTSPNVGGGGFNSEGDIQVEGYGMAAVLPNGGVSFNNEGMDPFPSSARCLEPKTTNSDASPRIAYGTSTNAFNTYGTPITLPTLGKQGLTRGAVVQESPSVRSRTNTTTFGTGTGNSSNINWIGIGNSPSSSLSIALRVRLDTPQTKLSSQTLRIQFKKAYGRVLTN
jgi:hypothetical protein